MTMIEIAKEFSISPSGRYRTDGPDSGEAFREDHLVGALNESGMIEIILDGTSGYPSSFLEEAFGGLIRLGYFTRAELHDKLKIVAKNSEYKRYIHAVWAYIDRAEPDATQISQH